jgi:hypothetical protein
VSDITFLLNALELNHAKATRSSCRWFMTNDGAPARSWGGCSHFFTTASGVMYSSSVESARLTLAVQDRLTTIRPH